MIKSDYKKESISEKIKRTTKYVCDNSEYVKINVEKLKEWINKEADFFVNIPGWFECHGNESKRSIETLIGFIFFVDSVNFCFWECFENENDKEYEYHNLVNNLNEILKKDEDFFNPYRLVNLDLETIKAIFNNQSRLIEERLRSVKESAAFIIEKHDGKYFNFVKDNEFDCEKMLENLIGNVSTFRDESVYKGKQVFLYKRSQILISDLYSALNELDEPIHLKNVDTLTMFADYRIPQVFRELEIFEYSDELDKHILNKTQIKPHSLQEIEIRAQTIHCVEMIKDMVKDVHGRNILSIHVDFVLWCFGEKNRHSIKPHHRVLTIFY